MFVKSNNLEFTRFIAAILVILSHSFPIEYGNNKREPLMVLSKGFISFGGAAVCIFFLCGGWLCIKSIQKVRWEKAIINRIKRLIPELFLIIGLSVILGSFLTVLPPIEYWGNMETWKYFLNCCHGKRLL